jgi:large subunit ribosomal protein L13
MAKHDDVVRGWHLIDAQGQVLGRLASRIALLLQGKHKPIYTPHVDCGDQVVVVNAEKVQVTGAKLQTKVYQRYSGYPGGLKEETLERLLARRPTEPLRRAVTGMLPKNPLGRRMAKKLHLYAGSTHPHGGQLR